MSRNRFTEEFKRDVVARVVDRGYAPDQIGKKSMEGQRQGLWLPQTAE